MIDNNKQVVSALMIALVAIFGCTAEEQGPADPSLPHISPELLLSLGQGDLQTGDLSFGIISSAAFLEDGSIVLLDGMESRVVRITPQGAFAWAVGRSGQGPGEFSADVSAAVPLDGGEIAVVDPGNGRITYLSPGGEVLRTEALGVSDPGRNWEADGVRGFVHDGFRRPEAIVRRTINGNPIDTLFTFGYTPPGLGTQQRPEAPILSSEARWCLTADGTLVVAVSTDPWLTFRPINADPWRIPIEDFAFQIPPNDHDEIRSLWQERLKLGDIPPRFASRIEVVIPERSPAMGHLTCQPSGNVLVQRPAAIESLIREALGGGILGGLGGEVWDEYQPHGPHLRDIRFPEPVRILSWHGDGIALTVRTDSSGRYILEKWAIPLV